MAYSVKAVTSGKFRRKNTVIICIASALSVLGLIMFIYSIIKGSWLFAASYFIALILLVTYIVIRINTVYITYLATDRENIILKNWSNDFLPYDVGSKLNFLAEFIPAGTKVTKIPIAEIGKIMIGTKNFIKRHAPEDENFAEGIGRFEKSKDYYQKRTVSGMDILYIQLLDGESYYMPIMNFNAKNVKKILSAALRVKPDIEMQFGGREYRNFKGARESER